MTKRPYDDLETDYLEEENESGFLSLVSVVIAFIAVAVFIALAWYAYQSSTKSDNQEEIQVVYPEDGPVREAPEETGGWQFPHQDKSVYNIVSGENDSEDEAKVEQILPAPEQPIKRPDAETKTWMNDKLKQDTIAKTDAERLQEALKQTEAETPVEDKAHAEDAAAAIAVAREAMKEKAAAVTDVAEVPVAATISAVKADPVAVAPKVVPKPPVQAVAAVASGAARLQLGAVKSDADARAQWQKMKARHAVLANKTLQVEAVTLPGKGTFYRIQATGFASKSEAKSACGQIAATGQACFAVGK